MKTNVEKTKAMSINDEEDVSMRVEISKRPVQQIES